MDLIEEKNEQENAPEEKNEGQTASKRMRIKDTRKIDYNRVAPASRPYQPMYDRPDNRLIISNLPINRMITTSILNPDHV
jgi:hypothetical protein